MVIFKTDADVSPNLASAPKKQESSMADASVLSALPDKYELVVYSNFRRLASCALRIRDKLEQQKNHDGDDDEHNQQFIAVLGLSSNATKKLSEERGVLGSVAFRFEWDGSVGVIKVLPSVSHDFTTGQIREEISAALTTMGIDRRQYSWGLSTTNKGVRGNTGKEPDESLYPGNRQPRGQKLTGWPALVIETGFSESLVRLRRDALWWFNNSSGEVRIVLVASVKKSKLRIEKWQLAPPNVPSPLTREAIHALQQQVPPPMPPLIRQTPTTQQAFALQEIEITPDGVTGGPLVLPFEALWSRAPQGTETDVVLGTQALLDVIRFL